MTRSIMDPASSPQDLERAASLADQAVTSAPTDPFVLAQACNVISAARDPARARVMAERATELAPGYAPAWSATGLLALRGGQGAQSAAAYDHAIRLSPRDPALAHWLTNRANARLLTGESAAAIRDAREAVSHDPSFHFAWVALAAALGLAGHVEQAQEAAVRAHDLEPEFGREAAREFYGRVLESPDDVERYMRGLEVASF